MANILASYVEKYILNPGSGLSSIDEDENQETKAVVSDIIEGEEGANSKAYSVSKLRTRNAELLGDIDSRYEGKKTTRKDLSRKDEIGFDPELAKLCFIDRDETDDLDEENSDDEVSRDEEEKPSCKQMKKSYTSKDNIIEEESGNDNEDYMRFAEVVEEDDSEDGEEDDSEDGIDSQEEDEDGSEYEGDLNAEEDDDDNDKFENESAIQEEESILPKIKTFSKDQSDQAPRGVAVKNQCYIYDTLFETRIGLQKVVSIGNQLPQHYAFDSFLKNDYYPQYKEKLLSSRKSIKKLIDQILNLQESLLLRNSETNHILSKEENTNCNEDEENENENENGEENSSANSNINSGKRKKRKLEEFEERLSKRHKSFTSFREETLNKWHEKSKLLVAQNKGKFDKFEIPPVQQIRNILTNKGSLIKKTQLLGLSRGNVYKILGKPQGESSNLIEEYDTEIFDDSDFYSRMLEDVLKSKISVSDDMTEVSRRWIDIQKLRKKAKKKVDTKASKGKKIRYEVMSKLQNFLAPCKFSQVSDEAQNQLFTSLFCKF